MDSNQDALKEILRSKLEELKSLPEQGYVSNIPLCSYINMKGNQCSNKSSPETINTKPRCRIHLKCLEVKQCNFMIKDDNGEETQCTNLTRSKGSFCYYHSVMEYSRVKAKKYYHDNKDKILKEKQLSYLINKVDKIAVTIDNILHEN